MSVNTTIHPLRRLCFEVGDLTFNQFCIRFGLSRELLRHYLHAQKDGPKPSFKPIPDLSKKFGITLDQAQALCLGTITDEDLAVVIEKARALQTSAKAVTGE